jgi:hypothetical protein
MPLGGFLGFDALRVAMQLGGLALRAFVWGFDLILGWLRPHYIFGVLLLAVRDLLVPAL